MSLGERLPPEVRLRTGWLIPVIAGVAAQLYLPGPRVQVAHGDQFLFAGLLAGGLLVGFLWQWYSPRPVGDRLVGPALLTVFTAVLFVLPMDELDFRPGLLLCGVGIIAGVVLTDLWHSARGRPGDD